VAALAQSQDLLLFASGHALEVAFLAGVNYVVLAFPRGRLEPASTAGFSRTGCSSPGTRREARAEHLAKVQIPTTTDDHRTVLAVLTFLNSS